MKKNEIRLIIESIAFASLAVGICTKVGICIGNTYDAEYQDKVKLMPKELPEEEKKIQSRRLFLKAFAKTIILSSIVAFAIGKLLPKWFMDTRAKALGLELPLGKK